MKVLVCSHTAILSISEGTVKVRTSESGLRLITNHEDTTRKQSILSANGLMEVIPDRPFTIQVSNFTDAPRELSKHMTVACAESPPGHYLTLSEVVCTKAPDDAVSIVQRDELRLRKL